jgi:hypothetical protein
VTLTVGAEHEPTVLAQLPVVPPELPEPLPLLEPPLELPELPPLLDPLLEPPELPPLLDPLPELLVEPLLEAPLELVPLLLLPGATPLLEPPPLEPLAAPELPPEEPLEPPSEPNHSAGVVDVLHAVPSTALAIARAAHRLGRSCVVSTGLEIQTDFCTVAAPVWVTYAKVTTEPPHRSKTVSLATKGAALPTAAQKHSARFALTASSMHGAASR